MNLMGSCNVEREVLGSHTVLPLLRPEAEIHRLLQVPNKVEVHRLQLEVHFQVPNKVQVEAEAHRLLQVPNKVQVEVEAKVQVGVEVHQARLQVQIYQARIHQTRPQIQAQGPQNQVFPYELLLMCL